MHFKTILLVSIFVAAVFAQFGGNTVTPKLRGIDKIGIGFDLVTMQLKMSPVELTWLGKFFTSPYDDKDYEIPMEIDSISTPDTFINRTVNVYNNVDEFREEQGRSTGISLKLGNVFSFTNTKETRNIRFTQDNRNYRFGIAEQTHIFYDIKLLPPFLLTPSRTLNEWLKRLPLYSPATKSEYTKLFSYLGTHYVMQASLGGSIRREELADIRNFTKLTEDYIHTQFGISFSLGTTPASDQLATDAITNDPTAGVNPGQDIAIQDPANGGGETGGGETGGGETGGGETGGGGDTGINGDPSDPNYNGDPNANTDPSQGNGKKRFNKSKIAINDGENKKRRVYAGGIGGIDSFSFSFNQNRTELKRRLEIRYSEYSHNITRLQGGNPTMFEPEQWRDWVQTIPSNPVIITYTLESIAELILNNAPLKASMEQAIYEHNNSPR
jgi:uncharacterized membrane protein YgcG